MKGQETIYVVDCIVPLPGRAREVHRLYLDDYVPLARERGLCLSHCWVAPPVWLEGSQANTLTFVWSVTGVVGYWAVEAKARWDPAAPDFWRNLDPLIQSRARQVMAEDRDIASLCDV